MSMKASSRYMMHDILYNTAWFYGIMLAIYILGGILSSFGAARGHINGFGAASALFLFIYGLNSFKEFFGMLLQNGISRKTMFFCRVVSLAATAFIMAVITFLLTPLFRLLFMSLSNLEVGGSLFSMLYGLSGISGAVLDLLLTFLAFFLLAMAGYCLTVLFYRLNTVGKVAVGAGAPIFLFILAPALDITLFKGNVSQACFRFLRFATGTNTAPARPWMPAISFLIASGLLILFGWLLTRRAMVRR